MEWWQYTLTHLHRRDGSTHWHILNARRTWAARHLHIRWPTDSPLNQLPPSHPSALNCKATVQTLPDFGADISVAGKNQPFGTSPWAPRQPPALPRHTSSCQWHCHVPYWQATRENVSRNPRIRWGLPHLSRCDGNTAVLESSQSTQILPECYPHPPPASTPNPSQVAVINANHTTTSHKIMAEYPSVFDGQIKTMKFHITDAKQFCAHAPRAIPFAYRDKLQTELELLQSQGVIAPLSHGSHRKACPDCCHT